MAKKSYRESGRYSKRCKCKKCNGKTPCEKPKGNRTARVFCDKCGPMDGCNVVPFGKWSVFRCACCGAAAVAPASLYNVGGADTAASL